LAHLHAEGCQLLREGANHSIWINPLTGRKEAIPRHSDVKRHLARSICRNLAIAVPKGA
jgi:mRNA interferase HicA